LPPLLLQQSLAAVARLGDRHYSPSLVSVASQVATLHFSGRLLVPAHTTCGAKYTGQFSYQRDLHLVIDSDADPLDFVSYLLHMLLKVINTGKD
jgi:hypothetical protein